LAVTRNAHDTLTDCGGRRSVQDTCWTAGSVTFLLLRPSLPSVHCVSKKRHWYVPHTTHTNRF